MACLGGWGAGPFWEGTIAAGLFWGFLMWRVGNCCRLLGWGDVWRYTRARNDIVRRYRREMLFFVRGRDVNPCRGLLIGSWKMFSLRSHLVAVNGSC